MRTSISFCSLDSTFYSTVSFSILMTFISAHSVSFLLFVQSFSLFSSLLCHAQPRHGNKTLDIAISIVRFGDKRGSFDEKMKAERIATIDITC